jgi:FtsZ-binding cell division protein ZapB
MRLNLALSAAVASLLFSAPALAERGADAANLDPAAKCERKQQKQGRKLERMSHRLDSAVERGTLSKEQAEQLKAEARQLQEEVRSQLQATQCQLSEEQRAQFQQRREALRGKMKDALKASKAPKDA